MPKKPIDYSKTIMYHFVCEDSTITNEYVGHTTDWSSRKRHHKSNVSNINSKEHNSKKYKIMNENGGWENWRMVPIEEYPCETEIQARIREEYWRKELKADMNTNRAYRTEEEKKESQKKADLIRRPIDNKKHKIKYHTDPVFRLAELSRKKNEKEKRNNKDKVNEKRRILRHNNKELLKQETECQRYYRNMKKPYEDIFKGSCLQKLLF